MLELPSEIVLTQDQLAAIGAVAVQSTYLERHVEILSYKLAGIPELYGKYFAARMMMDARLELLANLGKCRLRSQKQRRDFTDLISKLKEANNERNTIIHGIWLFPLPRNRNHTLAEIVEATKQPAEAARKAQKMKATEVRKTAIRLAELDMELRAFENQHWKRLTLRQKSEPMPLPQKQRRLQASKQKVAPARRAASL